MIRLLLALALAGQRSSTVRHEFQHQHPCPSTGLATGKCPDYVLDHITPLCAGGADSPDNLQWQTVLESVEKDKWERELCRKR